MMRPAIYTSFPLIHKEKAFHETITTIVTIIPTKYPNPNVDINSNMELILHHTMEKEKLGVLT